MTGRPTDYNDDIAIEICSRIAQGESLRSIGRDEAMPNPKTIWRWLAKHEEFSQQYARAKEESAEAHADEMLDIADDGTNDWMERLDKEGQGIGWQLNGEHVQRSRLRIDTRKWIASKLKPKKYGDKLEHGGKVEHEVTMNFAVPRNDFDAI